LTGRKIILEKEFMRRKKEESKATQPPDWPESLEWTPFMERFLKTINVKPEEFARWKPREPLRKGNAEA